MLHIGLLTVEFHLPGCHGLKEKRRRLIRLRDHWGRQTNLAVCESDFQDEHQRAVWSFAAVSSSKKVVRQMLQRVEDALESDVDAVMTRSQIEML